MKYLINVDIVSRLKRFARTIISQNNSRNVIHFKLLFRVNFADNECFAIRSLRISQYIIRIDVLVKMGNFSMKIRQKGKVALFNFFLERVQFRSEFTLKSFLNLFTSDWRFILCIHVCECEKRN